MFFLECRFSGLLTGERLFLFFDNDSLYRHAQSMCKSAGSLWGARTSAENLMQTISAAAHLFSQFRNLQLTLRHEKLDSKYI
jgi:hypothetical protein